ncbi:MAG: glycosidase [Clostridia bacterium]|nr:glycosidase [Clostridia bacterium]
MRNGAMLNAYPDSLGRNLGETAAFLSRPELRDAFRSFYILPSVFNTDLDHGFSVISYDLCDELATKQNLKALQDLGLDLTFDIILNHLSVLSPQFQDVLKRGDASEYRDFFIDWNRFWQNCGPMGEDGCIHPTPDKFRALNLRSNGLPVLMAHFPDGHETPFWCTFYQQKVYPVPTVFDMLEVTGYKYQTSLRLATHIAAELQAGKTPDGIDWSGFENYREAACTWLSDHRHYLGQLDVNYTSPLVWAWYDRVMAQLADYGASTIRLDAFTRLHKAPGRENFMNEPETWDILERLRDMAQRHGLSVLPEMHSPYSARPHEKIAAHGGKPYDYYLPGLLLDALDTGESGYLFSWAREQLQLDIRPVNMLGCHDGIPVRDIRGLLPDDRIDGIVQRTVDRGGLRKWIYGANPQVYQLNTTYYSALGCDDRKMLTARAIQLFMPGKPQIWYEDLLAGENDLEALRRDPTLDEREINRRRYSLDEAEARLSRPIVKDQLKLLKMRNTHPAFADNTAIEAEQPDPHSLKITWRSGEAYAVLEANVAAADYHITLSD